MKTSLDYDMREGKFEPKQTIMSLIFTDTKDDIGHTEFDLAYFANLLLTGKDQKDNMK
jgi:hypothetical protein